jgi:glycosyltransferase involved in cell wall biosynthesis
VALVSGITVTIEGKSELKPETDNRIRVACFSFGFIDYAIQLVNTLSKNRIEVFLLLPDERIEEHLASIDKGVRKYVYDQPHFYSPKNVLLMPKLLRQLSTFDPDVIHFQGMHPWFSLVLPWLRLRGYHVVTTFHDVKLHLGESGFQKFLFLPSFWKKYSEQVFVHGQKMKELLQESYPADRIHVIPIGEHNVSPLKKYFKGLKEEKDLILFFGRIYRYKGLEYLIRAEPLITREVPGAKIIIAGSGEDFEKYRRLMVNTKNFIVHNHFISFKEEEELFERCSLVVLPYIDASQSGVVPVAYAFKKPVVVTDVGSLSEVVDDGITGYVVTAGDEVALAEAVIKLLKDDALRKEMGEKGYQKLKRDLSWDKIAKKTAQVYRGVLGRNV